MWQYEYGNQYVHPEQERLEKEMQEMVRRQMIGDVHPEQERLEKEMQEMVRRQVWSNGVEWELEEGGFNFMD